MRKAARLTQAELAARAGISTYLLATIEQGKRRPNWKTLTNLAQALGVTLEYDTIAPPMDSEMSDIDMDLATLRMVVDGLRKRGIAEYELLRISEDFREPDGNGVLTESLSIPFSAKERQMLEEAAARAGSEATAWVRQKVLDLLARDQPVSGNHRIMPDE